MAPSRRRILRTACMAWMNSLARRGSIKYSTVTNTGPGGRLFDSGRSGTLCRCDSDNQSPRQDFRIGPSFSHVVEMLLGSAMRVRDLLSLNRADIDFENREARIIGKRNKQRTVFFTERALGWIRRYLDRQIDENPALFVCQNGLSRLKQPDLWRPFAH